MKNELQLEAQKRMNRAFKAEQRGNNDGTVSEYTPPCVILEG